MSAPYTNLRYGCQIGIESSYLAAYTFGDTTAADAIVLRKNPTIEYLNEYDGSRDAMAPGTVGMFPRVAPSGQYAQVDLEFEFGGPGVTYTATKFPNGHRLFRGAGLTSTFNTNLHDYTPTPEGSLASLAIRIHSRGMQYDITGAYVTSLKCAMESGRVPVWTASVIGIMTSPPTQVALPTLGAYTGTDLESLRVAANTPPKFEAGSVSLLGATPIRVKTIDFEFARAASPRARDNSTGAHGGFTPDRRIITADVTIEQLALGTFNPRALDNAATLGTFTATVGSVANNRFLIDTNALNTAQIVEVEDADDGPTAMTRVKLQFFPTTPTGNDEIRIRAN